MNHSAGSLLVALLMTTSVLSACGSDPAEDGFGSTTRAPTTLAPTTSGSDTGDSGASASTQPDPGTVTSTTTTTSVASGSTTAPGPQPVDPAWALYEDEFFVWGVAEDDVLNVRQGPGVSHPVVASFAPGERGIRRYDETRQANGGSWGAVGVPGGVGWVNLAYLRPEGSRPPRSAGVIEPSVEAAADDVQALLGAGEYETLSGFVDPTRGVAISLHAFVADDAVVLTPRQLAGAATNRELFLWGYTDGEGRPVETTIERRLGEIAGDRGLTSTDVIGHDTRLGLGNSIDNIAERFPGSHVVEYHFEGTSLYGDFDWSSVRFVFDASRLAPTGRPALLAIVQDTWTI